MLVLDDDCLDQRSPTFLVPGTSFVEDNFSPDGAGGRGAWVSGHGSGSNASDGELWRAADEALLTCPPFTSSCAARFLAGRRPVPVCGPGGWGPLV